MRTKKLFGILLIVFLAVTGLTGCNDDNNTSNPHFIENAKLQEEGQTLSPGQAVHLEGEGYLDSDDVILNFYWEINEPHFPEGYIKGYKAEILTCTSDGITFQMPYRKPESRVEVMLMRSGEIMRIGEVHLKDGTTPKDYRLYGINNNLHNKGGWIDAIQIMRCVYDADAGYDEISWSMDEHPDFHSAVGLPRSYGLCGLAATEGVQYPFFFDFCTLKWKKLSNLKTIALFSTPSAIGALQTTDEVNYSVNSISGGLEIGVDYAITTTKSDTPIPTKRYPLPAGLKAEQFGEYPSVKLGEYVFLSANKGNGKWAPVALNITQGFRVGEEIETDGLIPFSLSVKVEGKKNQLERIAGYAVTRKSAVNRTELYLFDGDRTFRNEPFAVFPNRAVSISANEAKQGTLTVHFEAYRAGNVTYEYSWNTKDWKPINSMGGHTHEEIIWAN